jgi:ribonuclease P protein component
MHIAPRTETGPARFGFIVTRAVGNATTRNLVRRRLRAACREALPSLTDGIDVVVRALPASAHASWATLHDEIAQGLGKGLAQQ